MIKCALFDLDGTLIDTAEDLGRATAYTMQTLGYNPVWTVDDYRRFVGNGALKLLDRAFEHKLSSGELSKALGIFKEYYNKILLDNAVAYDGIKHSLDTLKQKGIRLAVVTNKPHESAVQMVEAVFGKDYFDLIIGATEDTPKKPDPYSANKALEFLGANPDEALFFGDSDVDIMTAKNAGIKSVACPWGFRSRECLASACPTVIIDHPKDIEKLF